MTHAAEYESRAQPARTPVPTGRDKFSLRAAIESAGFGVEHWNDLTERAASLMQQFLALPPGPLGLQTIVENFAEKAANLTEGLSSGRLRAIQGIAHAAG